MSLEIPNEIVAGYIPAIHKGYLDLFAAYPEAEINVFDHSILKHINYLRKDIRALEPESAVQVLKGLNRPVRLLSEQAFADILETPTRIILPEDDVSHKMLSLHPPTYPELLTLEPVFLRWDREKTTTNVDVQPDRIVSIDAIPTEVIELLQNEAGKSTNWWRHIGAAIFDKNELVASSHNSSMPTEYSLYIDGDPRITASRGQSIETSIDIHAESNVIAEIARHGHALEGTEIYVSTFPCPNCAKLIAASGITTCYFVEGYAMLDGYDVLKSAGIEIVKIDTEFIENDQATRTVTYPTSQS